MLNQNQQLAKCAHDVLGINAYQKRFPTQTEEMLIARALPIMRIYIKPGGQRGYSGYCINLPQNLNELASVLPRCPKGLSIIVVRVKGRDNTFKDVNVRRQKIHNALLWLLQNNNCFAIIVLRIILIIKM